MEKIDFKKEAKELLTLILKVFVITFVVTRFFFMPVAVKGSSMHPNLQDGDYGFAGIINKVGGIDRFDVVIVQFDDEIKNPDNNYIVKRVIGLPGETVEYLDSVLYVNGEEVDETFIDDSVKTENLEVSLGDNEYFVLGDNREVSRDSRYYGPASSSEIRAKGVLRVLRTKDTFLYKYFNKGN